ncbi:MAG: HNH endonuclease [Candidatus Gastranaerophilales bacterium]|nr:HNH endonuclease [Candidatus Gastranaerophilales bacterium]
MHLYSIAAANTFRGKPYSLFEKEANLPCASCGEVMLTKQDIKDISNLKSNEDLADVFETYLDRLPIERRHSVVHLISELQKPENKSNTLQQLAFKVQDRSFKLRGQNNFETTFNILSPALSTIDHIQPTSLAGENAKYNLVHMCKSCNEQRGNMSYDAFIRINPSLQNNMQKFINSVKRMLLQTKNSQQLESIKNYLTSVQGTLNNNGIEVIV